MTRDTAVDAAAGGGGAAAGGAAGGKRSGGRPQRPDDVSSVSLSDDSDEEEARRAATAGGTNSAPSSADPRPVPPCIKARHAAGNSLSYQLHYRLVRRPSPFSSAARAAAAADLVATSAAVPATGGL